LPSPFGLRVVPQRPALSAAWHVGPELSDLASRANSRHAHGESGEQQLYGWIKKWGALPSTPARQNGRSTSSSRLFSSRPCQPSSPLFSPQVVVTQPPTSRLAVTTGGLSHPPSY